MENKFREKFKEYKKAWGRPEFDYTLCYTDETVDQQLRALQVLQYKNKLYEAMYYLCDIIIQELVLDVPKEEDPEFQEDYFSAERKLERYIGKAKTIERLSSELLDEYESGNDK